MIALTKIDILFKLIREQANMTTYNVQIVNGTNDTNQDDYKNYFVFNDLPALSGTDSPDVYSNAWISFPKVYKDGQPTFTYKEELYAYWGTLPSDISPGVVVSTGGTELVKLGPEGSTLTFSATPGMHFKNASKDDSPDGSFTIVASDDFTDDDTIVFGLAKYNGSSISPVATFVAKPSNTYTITPVTKFYVATGSSETGTVIDVTAHGTPAQINFTGRLEKAVRVTEAPNGTYTVKYVDHL